MQKRVLCVFLFQCSLFDVFLVREKIPQQCVKTFIVPMYKNKNGDISDATNYRPVLQQQLSLKCLNITFYRAFHRLLQPLANSLSSSHNLALICVHFYTKKFYHVM